MHFWSALYKSRVREADGDLLRIADACAWPVTIAPSTVMHPNADLGVFAAKTLQKAEVTGSCYPTPVFHHLPSG